MEKKTFLGVKSQGTDRACRQVSTGCWRWRGLSQEVHQVGALQEAEEPRWEALLGTQAPLSHLLRVVELEDEICSTSYVSHNFLDFPKPFCQPHNSLASNLLDVPLSESETRQSVI